MTRFIFLLVTSVVALNTAKAAIDAVVIGSRNAMECTRAQWTETGHSPATTNYHFREANRVSVSRCSNITGIQNGDTSKRNNALVDSLAYVTAMPYICDMDSQNGCGNNMFWDVVKQKESVVPLLIDKLSDTTSTLATVPNFGGAWAVGDVAFAALQEIIKDIPTFELLGVKFNNNGCGYCVYWDQVREGLDNRVRFQAAVRDWYNKIKDRLVWVESNDFSICDCRGKHPNGGHFELRK